MHISVLLSFILMYYLLLILPTQWLKIERIDNKLGINKKILQISDFHIERLRISDIKIQNVIKKEKPDYIFLTGDFLDKNKSIEKLSKYLKVFKNSKIPTYAVLGNHDYYLDDIFLLENMLKDNDIHLLKNQNIELDNFCLIGIDDYCSGHANIMQSFLHSSTVKPKVVITHDPNIILDINESFDYLMAGHLHGKQINIPFLFSIKPMGDLPKSGVWKGLNHSPYGSYYISKGIGQSAFNIRLFIRSELTIHNL